MASIIEMPKLSDTMTVGTLVRWLKQEGDTVNSGDMLAEVQTDKATMEVEAFDTGVLLKHYAPSGSQIAIGAPMCAIGEKGEALPELFQGKAVAQPMNKTAPTPSAPSSSGSVAVQDNTSTHRVKASPLAKKMAQEHGLDLESINGTGPSGRIVKVDIIAATIAKQGPIIATQPVAEEEGRREALIPMRATIARRLVESKTQIPHFYLDLTIDAQPLMCLRKDLNKSYADLPADKGGIKFTVNDLILKATAAALTEVPAVNASWRGDHIWHASSVHLAFAVALKEGLVTPVIQHAQTKNLRQLSTEARILIDKARRGKLSAQEMSNSTFTITNLGGYGIDGFLGIINPPNAAILSIGSIQSVPVVDENGNIVPGQRMRLGLSGDHRVIDGAQAAQFLAALKRVLEHPTLMLL